ncbi:cytochrome P450 [Streptomyces caeruleatus]|uniref:Cytochrome n=1 Tax=Streptomyces caeruleatus TaxID=661399 RepID=A0A117RS21_9ACTN|nr:cytochrome P450 [Streptomyces caeruleatus]KUO06137.1 cytochrome [Streptomyces caeruleatus]
MATRTISDAEDIDLSSIQFWGRSLEDRAAAFRVLREQPHPRHFAEPPSTWGVGAGYYALVRYADVLEADRNPRIFSSEPSALTISDMPDEFNEFYGSLFNMDDPRHAKIRGIVSRSFSPRMMQRISGDLQGLVSEVVGGLIEAGPGDFVAQASARVPLNFINDMMGVGRSSYDLVLRCSNIIAAGYDPEYLGRTPREQHLTFLRAGRDLKDLMLEIGEERKRTPTGDLTSALVNAHQDGDGLTDAQLASFFIILLVAGSETVRNSISHGLKLLTDNPDQRELLLSDLDRYLPGAIEEIFRLSSPGIWMRRTLTCDHEMNGHQYKKGDKVLLFFWSANRDETVFDRPEEFDITRSPNPHQAFGGGPHYCLGAQLARMELAAFYKELLTRIPDIRSVGEPDRLLTNHINGIKRMNCAFDADAARSRA